MDIAFFKNKAPNFEKLIGYGFIKKDDVYVFKTQMPESKFLFRIGIKSDGEAQYTLTDEFTEEEYTLHLVQQAQGNFVGKVRSEIDGILLDIADKCYEKNIFDSDMSHRVIEYVRDKYNCELEYLWEKFSNNAIWRRKDNDKWFCLMIVIPKCKLGLEGNETVNILDVRAQPDKIPDLIDNKSIFAGYHMNKKHWITVILDGAAKYEDICGLIDDSYIIAGNKPKK